MEYEETNKEPNQQVKETTRSFLLPHYIVFNKALTAYQRYVLVALIEREDNFKGCKGKTIKGKPFYVTQEWLAYQLDVSESTIKRSLKGLEDKEYIKRDMHKGEATTYSINWRTIDRFNDTFSFASRSDAAPASAPTCVSTSSSIELENKTGELAQSQVESFVTYSSSIEELPKTISDISDDLFACISDVADRINPKTRYDAFCKEVARASNYSLEYVRKAWQIISTFDTKPIFCADD
jgi:hypothetical protein